MRTLLVLICLSSLTVLASISELKGVVWKGCLKQNGCYVIQADGLYMSPLSDDYFGRGINLQIQKSPDSLKPQKVYQFKRGFFLRKENKWILSEGSSGEKSYGKKDFIFYPSTLRLLKYR